jgi:hypothetical protein
LILSPPRKRNFVHSHDDRHIRPPRG